MNDNNWRGDVLYAKGREIKQIQTAKFCSDYRTCIFNTFCKVAFAMDSLTKCFFHIRNVITAAMYFIAEFWMVVQATANLYGSLRITVMNTGFLAGSLLTAYYVTKGRFTAGDYVMYASYVMQLYEPLNMLGAYYRYIVIHDVVATICLSNGSGNKLPARWDRFPARWHTSLYYWYGIHLIWHRWAPEGRNCWQE